MKKLWVMAGLLALAPLVRAEVKVSEGWARASMPGQAVGGVFFKISSSKGGIVRSARCECAASVQLHKTEESQGMARMVEQTAVSLPAGQTVEFRPGGLHIMLIGLKAPLKEGQNLTLQLTVEEDGKTQQVALPVSVRAAHGQHQHGQHQHGHAH